MGTSITRRATGLLVVLLLVWLATPTASMSTASIQALQVALIPSLPSRQPVGTSISWRAQVSGATDTEQLLYRFSVTPDNGPASVFLDFGRRNTFRWTPIQEGRFRVDVSVKDRSGGSAQHSVAYETRSRLGQAAALVTGTGHPLVALYSAPACQTGRLRVVFRPAAGGSWTSTPWHDCVAGKSHNLYVAGMREDTRYHMRHEVDNGTAVYQAPIVQHRTGKVTQALPQFSVINPIDATTSSENIVLHSILLGRDLKSYVVATDLAGRVVWYFEPGPAGYFGPLLTRPVQGGTMLIHLSDLRTDGVVEQVLREIDLAGNALRETNVDRINEQLAERGADRITALSHEGIRLPNGQTLVIAYVERIMNDIQGAGPVDILGDMVIALDANMQVVWTWNTFDHLDPRRRASLDERCGQQDNGLPVIGCPLLKLARQANDWTHSNSVAYSAADANLLVSIRNQDWVVKIDYRDGAGSGKVLWRLGKDGDFTIDDGAEAWFSHQHDAHYHGQNIILYDNGNLRCRQRGAGCHSRGQLYNVDEAARRVALAFNADLGTYTDAFGSAQQLRNSNFHFTAGTIGVLPISRSIELRPNGTKTFALQAGAVAYRSFRMTDLFTP